MQGNLKGSLKKVQIDYAWLSIHQKFRYLLVFFSCRGSWNFLIVDLFLISRLFHELWEWCGDIFEKRVFTILGCSTLGQLILRCWILQTDQVMLGNPMRRRLHISPSFPLRILRMGFPDVALGVNHTVYIIDCFSSQLYNCRSGTSQASGR